MEPPDAGYKATYASSNQQSYPELCKYDFGYSYKSELTYQLYSDDYPSSQAYLIEREVGDFRLSVPRRR
jgi:hypothetical protein